MKIKKIVHEFSVCKIEDITGIDFNDEFCFLGKTDEEISFVCNTKKVPANVNERDDGWNAFRLSENRKVTK